MYVCDDTFFTLSVEKNVYENKTSAQAFFQDFKIHFYSQLFEKKNKQNKNKRKMRENNFSSVNAHIHMSITLMTMTMREMNFSWWQKGWW